MKADYEDRTYYAYFEQDEESGDEEVVKVLGQPRWLKNGTQFRQWANHPYEVYKRGLLPVAMLRPDETDEAITTW